MRLRSILIGVVLADHLDTSGNLAGVDGVTVIPSA